MQVESGASKTGVGSPGLAGRGLEHLEAQAWAAAGPAVDSSSRGMEPAAALDALGGGQLQLDVHGTPGAGEPSARSGHEGVLGSPSGCLAAPAARAGGAPCGSTWGTAPCERASPGQPGSDAAPGAHEAAGEAAERNSAAACGAAAPAAAGAQGWQEAAVLDGQDAAAGAGEGLQKGAAALGAAAPPACAAEGGQVALGPACQDAQGPAREGAAAAAALGGAAGSAAAPSSAPTASAGQVLPTGSSDAEVARDAREDAEAAEERSTDAAPCLPAELAPAASAPAPLCNGRQRRASAVAASRKVSSFIAHDAMEAWVRPPCWALRAVHG